MYTPDDIDYIMDSRRKLRQGAKSTDSLHRKLCMQIDALCISIELFNIGVYE